MRKKIFKTKGIFLKAWKNGISDTEMLEAWRIGFVEIYAGNNVPNEEIMDLHRRGLLEIRSVDC